MVLQTHMAWPRLNYLPKSFPTNSQIPGTKAFVPWVPLSLFKDEQLPLFLLIISLCKMSNFTDAENILRKGKIPGKTLSYQTRTWCPWPSCVPEAKAKVYGEEPFLSRIKGTCREVWSGKSMGRFKSWYAGVRVGLDGVEKGGGEDKGKEGGSGKACVPG